MGCAGECGIYGRFVIKRNVPIIRVPPCARDAPAIGAKLGGKMGGRIAHAENEKMVGHYMVIAAYPFFVKHCLRRSSVCFSWKCRAKLAMRLA
jgi:hypothetical protein